MPISQRAITDAWADLKSDIDANFRGQVENTAIPYPRIALDDPGLCSNLNPPPSIHGPRSFSWSAQGQASLDVQELKVTHFEGVNLQPAVFPDASHVDLPIGFSVAEVSGRYRLECLCIQSSWLGEMGRQTESRTGRITQTHANRALIYHATIGDSLTLDRISIAGNNEPALKLEADQGGAWYDVLARFMQHESAIEGRITSVIANVFATANFSQTMIAALNKKLR